MGKRRIAWQLEEHFTAEARQDSATKDGRGNPEPALVLPFFGHVIHEANPCHFRLWALGRGAGPLTLARNVPFRTVRRPRILGATALEGYRRGPIGRWEVSSK